MLWLHQARVPLHKFILADLLASSIVQVKARSDGEQQDSWVLAIVDQLVVGARGWSTSLWHHVLAHCCCDSRMHYALIEVLSDCVQIRLIVHMSLPCS